MSDPAVQMVLEMMQYMASLKVPWPCLAESFPILAQLADFTCPWNETLSNMLHITVPNFSAEASEQHESLFTSAMRAKTRYEKGTLPNCLAKKLWTNAKT